MNNLFEQWIKLKTLEKEITTERKAIEDQIIKSENINHSFTQSYEENSVIVKIKSNKSYKIDYFDIVNVAIKHKINQDMLLELFRFKAEINRTNWNKLDYPEKDLYKPFISEKIGRPTFSITPIKE